MGFFGQDMMSEAVRYAYGMGYEGIVVEDIEDNSVRMTVIDGDLVDQEMVVDFSMGVGSPRGYLRDPYDWS